MKTRDDGVRHRAVGQRGGIHLDAVLHRPQHVVATEEEDCVAAVRRITGGKGARIVFDPAGGQFVEKLAETMSERGILFVYGELPEVGSQLMLHDGRLLLTTRDSRLHLKHC